MRLHPSHRNMNDIETARKQVIEAGLELKKQGLVQRTWGNISARISDTQFVITPSGKAYETLTPEDIVKVNIKDLSFEGDVLPSSERGVHAALYAVRPEVSFIIHTHQKYASALSTLGTDLESLDKDCPEEAAILGNTVPCAEYGLNASLRLIRAVRDAALAHPESSAVLMRNHGIVAAGKSCENAFAIAHALESASEKRYQRLCGSLLPENEPKETNIAGYPVNTPLNINRIFGDSDGRFYVLHSTLPYTLKISSLLSIGDDLLPYLDDFASNIGTRVPCLYEYASQINIATGLSHRSAALLHQNGAICIGATEDEVLATQLVLEKNCMAALLSFTEHRPHPVDPDNAEIDRDTYLNSYSRLMNS